VAIDIVANGTEAIRSFASNHHAVLVVDLQVQCRRIPGSLYEIERICAERGWEMPLFVLCAASETREAIDAALSAGTFPRRLLHKPVSRRALLDAVALRLDETEAERLKPAAVG
jgi:FixJ family two-component response regulator